MSQLDINTKKGREAAAEQATAIYIVLCNLDARYQIFPTRDTQAAKIDALIIRDNCLAGIVEIKSRKMSLDTLFKSFNAEWLLTYQKLWDMASLSELLNVPGWGWLYLQEERVVLVIQLTDDRGIIVCRHRSADTETQRTCNGGKIVRQNAYIDMKQARQYRCDA